MQNVFNGYFGTFNTELIYEYFNRIFSDNYMFDLYEEAKDRLKSKNKKADSKLDIKDINHIIVMSMVDGIITKKELRELKEIKRYSFGNMEKNAEELYKKFMHGVEGKAKAIKEDNVEIKKNAQNIYYKRNRKGTDQLLNDRGTILRNS